MSHPDSFARQAHDPAMGNALIRFISPGTERKTEAHSTVSGDVSSTHSAKTEGHFNATNLEDSEGAVLVRYKILDLLLAYILSLQPTTCLNDRPRSPYEDTEEQVPSWSSYQLSRWKTAPHQVQLHKGHIKPNPVLPSPVRSIRLRTTSFDIVLRLLASPSSAIRSMKNVVGFSFQPCSLVE